ncbi:Fc receptor-like protein 5 [Brachyhypopomus gauderio]|uniref:Fc receptor-like protein 5 n=1 Tax=Brachyhypopomus gauderio TaxID=698409 RepID=UPI004043795F
MYESYSAELLSDSSRGAGGSYTLSPAALHHTGLYVCRAQRGETPYETEYSNLQPLWITGESPPVSLIIRPNRTQHFDNDSVTLSCEGQSDSAGWRVIRYTHSESGRVSHCLSFWGSVTGSTCTISSLSIYHTGVYWCQSESGESSNPVNITVHERPQAVLSVTPQSWMTEGVSVTLSCEVRDSSTGWTFSWYRAVPYREDLTQVLDSIASLFESYSVDLLSDSSRGAGGSYTLSPAALHHTGVYVCRAKRGEAPYETEYSNLQPLWITGESPPVSLIVSPNRIQHFYGDSLSLSCEGQSNSTGWTVRGYTYRWGVSECFTFQGSVTGSTCTISVLHRSHTGVYWCQSESGGSSNPVNITVHYYVILDSPVHPVTEGNPLTLHCLLRPTVTSDLRADFYKDGLLIQNQTAGEMTIHTVSKSDEGLYHCKHPERGESAHSWVSVRGLSHSEAPFSVLRLFSNLLAASPYLLVSIILGVKCYRARVQTGENQSQNAVMEE